MTNLALNTQNSTPFNTTIITTNNTAITMNSQEIADLVQSRHDNVKVSIERLVSQGVIQLPATQGVKNHLGQTVTNYIFEGEQGKRDTTIIVAQLSPTFLGTVVDRWMELEKQYALAFHPSYMIEDPVARAKKWIEEETAKQQVQIQLVEATKVIEVMQPTVDAYELIAGKRGVLKLQDAYKFLGGMLMKEMKKWMHDKKWIYFDRHGEEKVSQPYIVKGYLVVKVTAYKPQIKITYKGLAAMARQMKIELNAEDFK